VGVGAYQDLPPAAIERQHMVNVWHLHNEQRVGGMGELWKLWVEGCQNLSRLKNPRLVREVAARQQHRTRPGPGREIQELDTIKSMYLASRSWTCAVLLTGSHFPDQVLTPLHPQLPQLAHPSGTLLMLLQLDQSVRHTTKRAVVRQEAVVRPGACAWQR
jgi:hypothetical protein